MQHSRVCIFLCTRCLIRPSGERSHGISSALITFGRVAYSARNFSEATRSSARTLALAEPDSAACLSSNGMSISAYSEMDLFGSAFRLFFEHDPRLRGACFSENWYPPSEHAFPDHALDVRRRFEIFVPGRQLVRRPFHHFLEQQVHEQK